MKPPLYRYLLMALAFINITVVYAEEFLVNSPQSHINFLEKSSQTIDVTEINLASIEFLIEQEVGRLVLPKIYKNIGINAVITPFPGKRAQYVANSGIQDGEIMRIWTYGDETLNIIRVPTSYYYLETMAFVLKNSGIVIESKHDLAQYRVAKIRGVKHTNNITKGLVKLYDTNSTEKMFELLINNKVDVVLTNTMDGNVALSRLGLQNIVVKNKPLARLPLYHYLNNKYEALVPLIDKEIIRMKVSKELDMLIKNAEEHVIRLNQ